MTFGDGPEAYCERIDVINDEVEPLPLVPATWTAFRRFRSERYQ